MNITANGYKYSTCDCDEPDTLDHRWKLFGDCDYQICGACHQPIAGTAVTHHEDEDE